MKDRQHSGQKIPKRVIRICKSMKDRQHNGQKIPLISITPDLVISQGR